MHTGTADNGQEFAGHRAIAGALGADFYFATPYHSWERGLNEHTHGQVRQYFPKGTDFRQVTPAQVRSVEERINHWPRKGLGGSDGGVRRRPEGGHSSFPPSESPGSAGRVPLGRK